jgi:hypothetical protein
MKFISHKKKIITSVLILSLLAMILLTSTACEELGLSGSTTEATTTTNDPSVISTTDEAELAVYRHLLEQADSPEAKVYLADFYTSCYHWNVQSEYFKDGSGVWLVAVDMTAESDWNLNPYWQRAGWFVYQDGNVIPSNLFQVNALRIEADLQELSPEPEAE